MQRHDKEKEMQLTQVSDWRELAQRIDDGLEITLLWCKFGNRVMVAVTDERTGEQFELEIRASEALSAFYHPFAHRASRRLPATPTPAAPPQRFRRLKPDSPPTNAWDDAEEWE
jgi:hypothetical protein